MSSDIKQGWEPSAYVAEKFCQAFFGKGWKAIAPNDAAKREYIADVSRGLVAAVSADPLLSAAKDMQDALDDLTKAVRAVFGDKWTDTLFSDVLPVADAALRKSRGE